MNEKGTGSSLYQSIDEGVATPDDSSTYVTDTVRGSGSYFAKLTDMPADFASMSSLSADLRVRSVNRKDDKIVLYGQVFASDEKTALSSEVALATNPSSSWTTINAVNLTGVVGSNASTWNGAELRLRWAWTGVGTLDSVQLQLTAVELKGSYNPVSAPVAAFTGSPTSGVAPLTVQFADQSSGPPTSWAWDFQNDGTTDSTSQNPMFTFTTAGTYSVKLTVSNAVGSNSVIKTSYITVSNGASSLLLPNGDGARASVIVNEKGTGSNLYQSIDEGVANADNDTTYVTDTAKGSGSYFAKLTDMPSGFVSMSSVTTDLRVRTINRKDDKIVLYGQIYASDEKTALSSEVALATNPSGTWTTINAVNLPGIVASNATTWNGAELRLRWAWTQVGTPDSVQLRLTAIQLHASYALPAPPAASFTGTPTSGTAPLQVQFTDTSTGSPTSWAWDFQNDGTTDSTIQNPSFTYTAPGTYSVKLTVTNAGGSNSTTQTNYITVNPPAPTASFTGTPTSGTAPLQVQFTDTSTGSPTSWAWDFQNDGTTDSTQQNPSFTYTTPGTYSVKLTVTNAGGSNGATQTNYITVNPPPPTASFTGTPTSGTAPFQVQFTDTSTGSPTSWQWDFQNDGTVDSTAQNPSFTYTTPGTYTVKLTATNAGGSNSSTQTNYITVNAAPPVASFTTDVTSGQAPLTVHFTDTSTNNPTSWAWDFQNDGTTDSTQQNPSFTYTTAGTYTVKLTATNSAGSNSNTQANLITVTPGITHVSGTLTQDTTWGPGSAATYVIDNTVTVPQGITLTIQPGTIIKSPSSGGIQVTGGTLSAQGTAASPIVLTSINDSTVGVVTGNGNPQPGDWQGLQVRDVLNGDESDGAGGSVSLSHVRIAYAQVAVAGPACQFNCFTVYGSHSSLSLDQSVVEQNSTALAMATGGSMPLGSVSVTNDSFTGGWLGDISVSGSATVTNNSFIGFAGGLSVLDGSSSAGMVNVSGNTFTNIGQATALAVTGESPTVENNTVTGSGGSSGCTGSSYCGATITVLGGPAVDFGQLTGNGGSGNVGQSFAVGGILTASGSLSDFLPTGWQPLITDWCGCGQPLEVSSGVTLTIPPGTVVKSLGAGIDVVGGSLVAQGTAASPIVFTSIHDSSPGGVTATNAPPSPGDWVGFRLRDVLNGDESDGAGGSVSLLHVRIAYAQVAVAGPGCQFNCFTVYGAHSSLSLDQSVVEQNSTALAMQDLGFMPLGSASVTNSSFTGAGLGLGDIAVGGSVTVTNDSFTGFASGLSVFDDSSSAGTANVSGNTLSNIGQATALAVTGESPTVENNTVTGSGGSSGCTGSSYCGATITVLGGPAVDFGQLTGNGGSGNVGQSFALGGVLTASGSLGFLPPGWMPVITSWCCGQDFEVAAGVTLTVPAGMVVKSVGSGIAVAGGSLVAHGTAASPVVFTSLHDGSVGGATADGDPSPGDWRGLAAYDDHDHVSGGTIDLAYTQISYASIGVASCVLQIDLYGECFSPPSTALSSVTLDHFTVDYSQEAIDLSEPLSAQSLDITNITGTAIGLSGASSGATISDATIDHAHTGLVVNGGSVVYRGSITNVAMGIQACDWGSGCGVDAAYVDWGTPDGPFPNGGAALVCGNVLVSPWLPSGDQQIFGTANCDGSPTPDQQLGSAAASFSQGIDSLCSGDPDCAQVVATYYNCLNAAMGLAESSLPIPVPGDSPTTDAQIFAGDVVTGVSTWAEATASVDVGSPITAIGHVNDALGAVSSILAMARAYHQCSP